MESSTIYYVALALALGMTAQVVAARLRVPSIILLLATGLAAGPDALGWIDPTAIRGARNGLVTLAVTVILFEGGLALRWDEVRAQQRSLTLLLSVGAAMTMLAGTLAAHLLLSMPWTIALLYGSLMIVTGPTVVTPLLSRLRVERTVRELLINEGVLIDPLGAILALVIAEYVLGHSAAWEAIALVLTRLGTGAAIGGSGGIVLGFVLRRNWIPEDLRNPAVLASVLLLAAVATRTSSEAGLMCAVTQGVVMANGGLRSLGPLRQFKEEITVLLLSLIFVLLAVDLSPKAVLDLGIPGVLVVLVLVWVARPASVLVCTTGSDLSLRQRLFVSWICPRGIVAVAVAGLFKLYLEEAGRPGGTQLEALVFLTVGFTVIVQGSTAPAVARLLGVDQLTLRGTVLVGADHLGRLLARVLSERGRPCVLLDVNPGLCAAATEENLVAFCGDALAADGLEAAGVRYADTLVALTRNSELNTLIVQNVRNNFRVERLLSVSTDGEATAATPFPGHFPGVDEVNRCLRMGQGRLVTYAVADDFAAAPLLSALSFADGEFALLVERRDSIVIASGEQALKAGDRLLCLRTGTGDHSPGDGLNEIVTSS